MLASTGRFCTIQSGLQNILGLNSCLDKWGMYYTCVRIFFTLAQACCIWGSRGTTGEVLAIIMAWFVLLQLAQILAFYVWWPYADCSVSQRDPANWGHLINLILFGIAKSLLAFNAFIPVASLPSLAAQIMSIAVLVPPLIMAADWYTIIPKKGDPWGLVRGCISEKPQIGRMRTLPPEANPNVPTVIIALEEPGERRVDRLPRDTSLDRPTWDSMGRIIGLPVNLEALKPPPTTECRASSRHTDDTASMDSGVLSKDLGHEDPQRCLVYNGEVHARQHRPIADLERPTPPLGERAGQEEQQAPVNAPHLKARAPTSARSEWEVKCEHCDEEFPTPLELIYHQLETHQEELQPEVHRHVCSLCGKGYHYPEGMLQCKAECEAMLHTDGLGGEGCNLELQGNPLFEAPGPPPSPLGAMRRVPPGGFGGSTGNGQARPGGVVRA